MKDKDIFPLDLGSSSCSADEEENLYLVIANNVEELHAIMKEDICLAKAKLEEIQLSLKELQRHIENNPLFRCDITI